MIDRRPTCTFAAVLALAILAACARDNGELNAPDVYFGEWDSAGVRIVESSGQALATTLGWVVDTVPDLQLGQVQGDAPLLFDDIGGIASLPDGGLVVLDGGSGELRWFEASGEYVRTTGGKGKGPGEFIDPHLVPRFQTDSLLVFDPRPRAFTWIGVDGSGERRLAPGGELFIGTAQVSAGSRALFSTFSTGPGACRKNEPCEDLLLSRWVEMDGTGADTITAHTIRWLLYSESQGTMLVNGPFDQKGLAAVGPAGPVVEGNPRFELRQFDAEGQLAAVFRVDAPPRDNPEDALDQYVEPAPDARRMFEMMGLPDVLPAFQSLQVDRLGWYWAELFRIGKGGACEWLVFDPQGRARGMVELPSGLEVHAIQEDHILGRWVDDLGVEYVRRHALHRSGS